MICERRNDVLRICDYEYGPRSMRPTMPEYNGGDGTADRPGRVLMGVQNGANQRPARADHMIKCKSAVDSVSEPPRPFRDSRTDVQGFND